MISRNRLIIGSILLLIFVTAGMIGGPANEFDVAISAAAAELRSSLPAVERVASAMTLLGGIFSTLGAAVVAALFLLWRSERAAALLLISIVIAERLLVDGLKEWVGRSRPELEHLPASLAYPSGHAANSMTAFLAIALIAVAPGLRRSAAIVAIALSVMIGVTRVIIGVHWPSDVIGGWAFGFLFAGLAVVVGEQSGALPEKAKHDVVGRHLAAAGKDEAS